MPTNILRPKIRKVLAAFWEQKSDSATHACALPLKTDCTTPITVDMAADQILKIFGEM